LYLRNIARGPPAPVHSKAEMLPPIDGLSSSRRGPAVSSTVDLCIFPDPSLSSRFTTARFLWG
jgi:hypothetical protein